MTQIRYIWMCLAICVTMTAHGQEFRLDDVLEDEFITIKNGSSMFSLIIVILIFIGVIFGLIYLKKKKEEKY